MNFIKSIELYSIKDFKDKIRACQELGFSFKLDGELREFNYDIMTDGVDKPSLVGGLSTYSTEKIDFLRSYKNFDEKDVKTKHIRANDDPYIPKEDIIEMDVLVWGKRYFVFENIRLEIYN